MAVRRLLITRARLTVLLELMGLATTLYNNRCYHSHVFRQARREHRGHHRRIQKLFYAPSSATTAVAPLEQAPLEQVATQNTDEYESVSLSSNASQSVSVCLSRRVYADMRLCALADEDDEEVSEDSSLVFDTASSSYLRAPLPLPFPRRRGIAADPSAVIAGGSRCIDARCVQSQEACHTKACAQSYHGRYLAGVVWAAQGGRAAFLLTRIVHHIRITLTGG